MRTWEASFRSILDLTYWPPYTGPSLVLDPSMRRLAKGRPKSTPLHNEMDVREVWALSGAASVGRRITIGVIIQRIGKKLETSECTTKFVNIFAQRVHFVTFDCTTFTLRIFCNI